MLPWMYRCELCGVVVPPRTRCYRVPVETRPKQYPMRPEVFRVVKWENGRRRVKKVDDPGGSGYESVREARACPSCYANWQARS